MYGTGACLAVMHGTVIFSEMGIKSVYGRTGMEPIFLSRPCSIDVDDGTAVTVIK